MNKIEIKKGDWFKCVKDYDNNIIKKGCYFMANADDWLEIKVNSFKEYYFGSNTIRNHFKKLFTIQDLRDGKCAVENDDSLDSLQLVLNSCFGDSRETMGVFKYYFKHNYNRWDCSDITDLPNQSVNDFLPQIENITEFPKINVSENKPFSFSDFPFKERPKNNNVEPNHYGGKENPLEVIKIIQHYNLSFELGNVLKYIIRHDKKKLSLQDLQKAKRYLEYEISKYN